MFHQLISLFLPLSPLSLTPPYLQGEIFINGLPVSKMREWFVVNTGYVRQLATSFYNELTVRENLLFSMNMQAQRKDSLSTKLKRVEQVIREMGLEEQADVVVGDGIGLGLSGGQVGMGNGEWSMHTMYCKMASHFRCTFLST